MIAPATHGYSVFYGVGGVACTRLITGMQISTISIQYAAGTVYETRIYGGPFDQLATMSATEADAMLMHRNYVSKCRRHQWSVIASGLLIAAAGWALTKLFE